MFINAGGSVIVDVALVAFKSLASYVHSSLCSLLLYIVEKA